MFSLKPLAIAFFLGTLFTMEMPFYTTPPANAQAVPDNNCVLFALAGASRIPLPDVIDITGFMDGPALGEQQIVEGLGRLGLGTVPGQTFFTREQLENYLRFNGDAEYIVGWRPVMEGSIGHVVNARVFNQRVRYIDNQNQCESPNPAAEPPANGAFRYFAWLTRSNAQADVDDIGFLLGGLTLVQAGNTSLAARSINIGTAPQRSVSFGNFTATCRNISLSTNFNRASQVALSAECQDEQGNYRTAAIILDGYIVNDSGTLRWQSNGGFGASVQNCNIKVGIYTVLTCDADNGRGSLQKAAINLDTEIENRNGELTSDI